MSHINRKKRTVVQNTVIISSNMVKSYPFICGFHDTRAALRENFIYIEK